MVQAGTTATGVVVITGVSVGAGTSVKVAVGWLVGIADGAGVLVGVIASDVEVLCAAGAFPPAGFVLVAEGIFFGEHALKRNEINTIRLDNLFR